MTSSKGIVPSARTAFTAVWPHACTMPGPVRRATGEVTFPCAATVATKMVAAAIEVRMCALKREMNERLIQKSDLNRRSGNTR